MAMLCISKVRLYDGVHPEREGMDVLVDQGKIIKTGHDLAGEASEVLDGSKLCMLPGLIDAHCHLREPGFEYKEDIRSGTQSAARGGFTQVACMANTDPVIDSAPLVHFVQHKARKAGLVKVHVIGAITKNMEGRVLTEMGELKEAGVIALSDDGKTVESARLMKQALEYAKGFELLLISHCEEPSLSEDGAMNEGYHSTVLGLRGISRAAEDIMTARDILLAEAVHGHIHIAHVSTRGSVELIRQAKKRGVNVTCETAPHYFSADDSWVIGYNANTKVSPPLRTEDDCIAVKEGLKDGTIDIIATDHAPHHADEKNVEYDLAAKGFSGFETAFALSYTHLVRSGVLNLEELVQKMCTKPAGILRIPGGTLRVGDPADFVLADLEQPYHINSSEFRSKGKNTPFDGCEVYGRILHTYISGTKVY